MSSNSRSRRKAVVNTTVSVKLGCNCRRPRLSSLFNPKPKSKLQSYDDNKHAHVQQNYSQQQSSSSCGDKNGNSPYEYPTTSTPSSSCSGSTIRPNKSLAIEKDSSDPYLDFRQSMLQMIVENQIYSKEELKHLLNCFLQLNSPSLHGLIIRVFTEIWNTFFFASRPARY